MCDAQAWEPQPFAGALPGRQKKHAFTGTATMQLLDLPFEVICSLPLYVRNIEDFTEASSTCRALYHAFLATSPNTILRLAAASSPTFFTPHLLIAGTVRQVSDWALKHPQNTSELQKAFHAGIDGLFDLCVEKAGLTLDDIRRLHAARFSLINPFSDKIDKMAGNQWNDTPNFWSDGVSEPASIYAEADRAALQIIIYGELFSSTMRAYLEPRMSLSRFSIDVRLDYIKYCIPDMICEGPRSELEVLPVGPYVPGHGMLPSDQVALAHISSCSRWQRLWEKVMHGVGPGFETEWKQRLWINAVQFQGLGGLEMIVSDEVPKKWQMRLRKIYSEITNLQDADKPDGRTFRLGQREKVVSYAPDFSSEVDVCCRVF
ncbi:hypothetical protein VNI00_011069 [Paramarasmius palmivorus]|uniref:F-box domain-containing protein n=1 Tax=Paramarasmius palmivorus TaxID=297713 RepID=A0AAW0CHE1_9AGAR